MKALSRNIARALVMTAAVGLIATMAIPAYAFSTTGAFDPATHLSALGSQSMQSDVLQATPGVTRDPYGATSEADLAAQKAAAAAAAAAAAVAAAQASLLKLSSTSAVTANAYPSVVPPEV